MNITEENEALRARVAELEAALAKIAEMRGVDMTATGAPLMTEDVKRSANIANEAVLKRATGKATPLRRVNTTYEGEFNVYYKVGTLSGAEAVYNALVANNTSMSRFNRSV